MLPEQGWIGIRSLVLFVVLAIAALVSGYLFVFLALSISAYELAINPDTTGNASRRVLVSHLIALIAGFIAYHTLAPELSALQPPPAMSSAGLRLIASGFVAALVTMGAMRATNLRHYPAYATALTLGVGILVTVEAAVITFIGALALVAAQSLLTQIRSNASGTSM